MLVLLAAGLVLLWAWRSRTPWRALGLVRDARWPRTVLIGFLLGVALKLVMKILVMPLLGAPPVNAAYQFLVGNAAALPGMLFMVLVAAGFGEEVVFRGFLFERAGRWFGRSAAARTLTVLVSSALFALAHLGDQGIPGVQQAAVTGLVFGSIYAVTGNLWLPIVAHAAFDLTAVGIIYGGLEARLAHLVIR